MSTPTPKPSALASVTARLMGTEPQPKDEDLPEIEEEEPEDDNEEAETAEVEESEETEEAEEPELPDAVKAVLKKNRKITREAEARALAAEKALEALQNPDKVAEEPAPEDDKFKKLFVTTAAKAALSAAGFDKGTDRFVKMIDFDDLEVNEDGTIDGLDEQVEVLKKEFSDLIAPKPIVKKTVRTDAAGRREATPVQKSSASKLSDRLTSR